MAEAPHSECSVAGRHPLHAIEVFDDEAERDAHVYNGTDEGKVVRVNSPLGYWLIESVSAGVATFAAYKLGGVTGRELAPAAETATGDTYNGQVVYARRFTGTMPTSSVNLIASGVTAVVAVFGWASSATLRFTPMMTASSQGFVQLTIATGAVDLLNGSTTFDSNPYDITLWYTKT